MPAPDELAGYQGSIFRLSDEARRQAGRAYDAAALGPQESPFRIAAEMQGARLRAYQNESCGREGAILIVPAPFKRAYIWDLLPDVSVIRRCRERNFAVYLLEWLVPGKSEDGFGLSEYAGSLPAAAVQAIASETGQSRIFAMGHSVGGTLAAIFASLHPQLIRALALIDAPIAFGEHGGPLAAAIAKMPHARSIRAQIGSPVPGTFINLLSVSALPLTFHGQRWMDNLSCLANPRALRILARAERWMLDEFPLPGQLFEDMLELLYRDDHFNRGALAVSGKIAGVDRLQGPILAVLNPHGHVVPPASITVALDKLSGVERHMLNYAGDRGVGLQHLGPLIGPSAHQSLWPQILDWLSRRQ